MTNTNHTQSTAPIDTAPEADDVAGFLETKTAVIAASIAGGAVLGGAIGAGVVAAAAGVGLAINAATSSQPSGPRVAPGT
jgi:hypothetical protein